MNSAQSSGRQNGFFPKKIHESNLLYRKAQEIVEPRAWVQSLNVSLTGPRQWNHELWARNMWPKYALKVSSITPAVLFTKTEHGPGHEQNCRASVSLRPGVQNPGPCRTQQGSRKASDATRNSMARWQKIPDTIRLVVYILTV